METIKSSADISELFSQGRRIHTPNITFIMMKRVRPEADGNDSQHDLYGRVAFIAGKKQGNAVWRNKAKRRMRAILYDLKGPWTGFDVIMLAKPGINSSSHSAILDSCTKALSNSPLCRKGPR